MTNKKLTNRQAIGVLDGLWSNPLFGEAHRQAFEIGIMAIKALEQEPCEDAISRQAVENAIYDATRSMDLNYGQIMEYLDRLPSVSVAEKTGHWVHWASGDDCSECGWSTGRYIPTTKYCPNCGCKMEVENG